jgi:hypothetical protein
MNWFLLFKVYWIWPCLAKPCAWFFPYPKHKQYTLGSIQRSPLNICLQKMQDQVKEDLVFTHTRNLYWIFIQNKIKSWPKNILKYISSFVWTRMSNLFDSIMITFCNASFAHWTLFSCFNMNFFFDPSLWSPTRMHELMEKTMEQMTCSQAPWYIQMWV